MGYQRLTWEIVRAIRKEAKAGKTFVTLTQEFEVSRGQLSKILNNKCWVEEKKGSDRYQPK